MQSSVGDMIHLSDDFVLTDSSDKTPTKKGKKHKRNAKHEDMRVHTVLHSTAIDKSFFTSNSGAYQRAISIFKNAFGVDRRSTKLTLQRRCSSTIDSGTNAGRCKKIDQNPLKCGIFNVPDELRGAGIECKEKAGSCKTKSSSGAGVDADFIMFAGARDGMLTIATLHCILLQSTLVIYTYRYLCPVWFISTCICCFLWCR